jgi:hypothetical protein
MLATYFGEPMEDYCGKCDNCIRKGKAENSYIAEPTNKEPTQPKAEDLILSALKLQPLSPPELRLKTGIFELSTLVEAASKLVEQKKIHLQPDGTFALLN